MTAIAQVKSGFWLGVGIFLALLVIGMLQALTLRAVTRHG